MRLQIYKHWNGGYVGRVNGNNIIAARSTRLEVSRWFNDIALMYVYRDIRNKNNFNIVSSNALLSRCQIDKSNYTVLVLFASLILM